MARVMLQNVTKQYRETIAVRDVSFVVNDGEFFVILGPSGCGKTTLLRLIAGLEQVTSGQIFIGQRMVNDLAPYDRNIAMVFESPTFGLFPHMTAYDNMAFGLRIHKENLPEESATGAAQSEQGEYAHHAPKAHQSAAEREAAIKNRVESMAGRLGLGQYLHRKQRQLSSGHNQSLALGRSMMRHPEVFLMDCPMAQIDPVNRMTARAELRRRHVELGVTTIYVTHDQEEAMALGERIAVMDDARVQQIGSAHTLYAHPTTAFVAGFIGSPPMNLLPAWVVREGEGEHAEMYLQGQGFRVPVPEHLAMRLSAYVDSEILLGLRPEAIGEPQRLAGGASAALVDAKVTAREYTGSDVYLHLSTAAVGQPGPEIVARMSRQTNARVSDLITVAFDMEQLYAFDRRTGNTLL
jgi:multiple sugar transport system ATP-binding protein